jgi:Xaa-Pro dipeptidase
MLQPFLERRDHLARRAAAAGIDKLMVCDPLNLFYLTGVRITPYERFIALMLDAETGRCQLILPGLEGDAAVGHRNTVFSE